MNSKFLFLPALLLLGADMLARVAVQGIEQGLVSMVMELALKRRDELRFFFKAARLVRQNR